MRVLVTGASGFVGSRLVPRLSAAGHTVSALGRDSSRVREALAREGGTQGAEVISADALSGRGLDDALDGVEVAYYLIHSMERAPARAPRFVEREHIAADNFAAAAARAHVRRIVYLGGLTPHGEELDVARSTSAHLSSREQVERILLAAVPDSIALRASIVIGARSRSFRLLVRLVERMPLLALPAWRTYRTQPIDARDVIEMLAACIDAEPPRRSLEVAGPEILSYGEMLARIAELMMLGRPAVGLGVNLTGVTARVAAAIAGEDPALVLALMQGLQTDLLPLHNDGGTLLPGERLHSFDSAVERALSEWEREEPLAAR